MKTKTSFKPFLIAAMLGAAAPLAVSAGDNKDMSDKSTMERAGDYVSDAALTTKINAALVAQKELSALDISVDSNQGVVTLSGTVDSDAQIELAEKVVEDLDGVKAVDNKLESRS